MKSRSIRWAKVIGMAIAMASGVWVVDALAADATSSSRAIWDLAMRWVNFIILAAVIVKYARKPVADFFKAQKEEVAKSIKKYEVLKEEADAKIRDSQKQLADSQERLSRIKERIAAEGQKRKEQIIVDAQNESRLMLKKARLKIDSQIREAYASIKNELIDTATEQAAARLPKVLTAKDQERLVLQWIEAAQK